MNADKIIALSSIVMGTIPITLLIYMLIYMSYSYVIDFPVLLLFLVPLIGAIIVGYIGYKNNKGLYRNLYLIGSVAGILSLLIWILINYAFMTTYQ